MDYRTEYTNLLESQHFCVSDLDYSTLDDCMATLSVMAEVANSGISVYDNYKRRHLFVSRNFGKLFKYDMLRVDAEDADYFGLQINPNDQRELYRVGTIGMRFCIEMNGPISDYKLVTEYRINISGQETRVIEQFQVIKTDSIGNIWLTLSVLDISPNQTPLDCVESKLLNYRTGEVLPLPMYPEYATEQKVSLTSREKEVLNMVRDGFLSKEISDRMSLSVHTVNTYRQRILEKLCANNSHEAIRFATELGLLS